MGTLVTIEVVPPDADAAVDRAFDWFRDIEARCSRFDERSELAQITRCVGVPVTASPIVFEAVRFALSVAEDTDGAFDPTVGRRMETRGFNREDRSGRLVSTAIAADEDVSFRDVTLDADRRTITLRRPLLLDLGAIAKGLAVDVAARELQPFHDFAIDAGGDLYLAGHNGHGEPWSVGIRHPRIDGEFIDSVRASNSAVCTSGDYERPNHILDPHSGMSPTTVCSVTVVAATALAADALATAAFVLGPHDGIQLLERHGVEGLIVTAALERIETSGFHR
jgi:thiamine biosynthesis lipoprotein